MVAPFAVAVYCCPTCVEYGDGQDMKVVEVPCRSIEGFKGKPVRGPNVQLYINQKCRTAMGDFNGDSAGLNPMPLPGGHGVRSLHARGQFGEFKFARNPSFSLG